MNNEQLLATAEPCKGLHASHGWEPYLYGDEEYRGVGYRRADGVGYVLPCLDRSSMEPTGDWWTTFAHPMLCGRPGWHHHAFGTYGTANAAALAFDTVYALELFAGNVDRCPELRTERTTDAG